MTTITDDIRDCQRMWAHVRIPGAAHPLSYPERLH